ncbi:hypothetical protein SAMN05444358_103203 [Ruegeria halocynthiae]|uniref:PH domain-containing protein n=1 Tax=Ruegeria halocynthiae TaxID=985054 RepID=A0A1H2ZF40_9RHOB|nr:hypothetical protein [Ruegeria halocynthiae]SDX16020.1 hypothetical protein SAMN05444358_103203 [Ruegeria halocynthiae]
MADPVTFKPDKSAYLRTNTWLAAAAMAGAMIVLWIIGNPYVWTGAPAGLAAVGIRAWYLASEELTATWKMSDTSVSGPGGRDVSLNQIEAVNIMGSFVQIVTKSGDKHLIKYQADPAATKAAIERAMA